MRTRATHTATEDRALVTSPDEATYSRKGQTPVALTTCVILCGVNAPHQGRRPRAAIDFLREAWRGLGAFRSAYGWLLRDLITFARRRVAAVVALNLLGVALQWTVVGAVLLFVGELTGEGGAFQVPLLSDVELPVEASFEVVAAWGLVVLILVLVAALSTYGAETVGFSTAQRYVESSGQHILRSALSSANRPTDTESPAKRLQIALIRDQLMVLRALLVVQRSLRAILMVVVAAFVLALINPLLTAVVGFVAALFIVPYYLLNRRMVGAAAALEQRNLSAKLAIARTVEHATSREPNAEVRRAVLDSYATDPAIDRRWAVLRDIMLGGQRTTALMTGLVGTCLVAVVVAFSLIIASDGASWVAALTYIIGLNLASGAFIQVASLVTAANRFLPHVQDFIAYTSTFADAPEVPDEHVVTRSALPSVHVAGPVLPHSDTEIALASGTRLLCVCPGAVDRLNVQSLLSRLVEGSKIEARRLRDATFFCGDHSSLPPVPLHHLLGERGLGALAELDLAKEVARLPQGDTTTLTPEIQEQLSPLLRYVLGMLEGIESELLVLGWKSFARLSAEDRSRLLDLMSAQPVMFVTAGTPRKQPPEATHTAILTEHGIAGMGDAEWYQAITAKLPLSPDRGPERVGAPSGASLIDLDDT